MGRLWRLYRLANLSLLSEKRPVVALQLVTCVFPAMAIQLERVLISDSVDSSCRRILEEGGMAVDYRPGLSGDDLLTCIKVRGVPISSGIDVFLLSHQLWYFAGL